MEIWNLIVHSNAFNFIIMVLLLAVLIKKLDVSSRLGDIKEKIVMQIEMSKNEREKANVELQNAKSAVANLDKEIEERTEQILKNIDNTVKQTLENAQGQVQNILDNVQSVIENEEKQVSSQILNSVSRQALQSAKNKIIERLKVNPELHKKYIDEAIEEIDKVTL